MDIDPRGQGDHLSLSAYPQLRLRDQGASEASRVWHSPTLWGFAGQRVWTRGEPLDCRGLEGTMTSSLMHIAHECLKGALPIVAADAGAVQSRAILPCPDSITMVDSGQALPVSLPRLTWRQRLGK